MWHICEAKTAAAYRGPNVVQYAKSRDQQRYGEVYFKRRVECANLENNEKKTHPIPKGINMTLAETPGQRDQ